jgi:hypothetical protein
VTKMRRIVAADRGDLVARTLRPVERLGVLGKHLDVTGSVLRDSSGSRRLLVLIGEGGIGKSVLLGQYLDHLDAVGNRGVVLVSCASIESGAALTTMESLNSALAVATGDSAASDRGLIDFLGQMRSDHGAVSLLIDTLDLRIGEESVVAFAALIHKALEVGDVIVTCRTQEYHSYLQHGARRLAERLDPVVVPSLTDDEIAVWTRPADRAAFLASLRSGVSKSRSLRIVCSIPVRLALTCQTFADDGHVPPELTVASLFERYWDIRVARHGGLSHTDEAYAKADVTLKLAAMVVKQDGRVVLKLPASKLGEADRRGVKLLASEGVIRDHGTEVEFFHQTFAEYAHARWLLSQGLDAPAIEALRRCIVMGQNGLWDIVTSLLLQVRAFEDYQALAGLFPVTSAQSARARASAALRRPEPSALTGLMAEVSDHVEFIPAMLGVLADALYERLSDAYSWTVNALYAHPAELAKEAAKTLTALLPRLDGAEVEAALRSALSALFDAERHVERSQWTTLTERLILALDGHPAQHEALTVLRETYARLGGRGQQAALRAHLALRNSLSGEEISQLADCALTDKCPELRDDESVALISAFWQEPAVRNAQGWDSLTTMMRAPLPRGWQNGQVRFAVSCAVADEGLRGEIFDAAFQAVSGHTVNSVSATKHLAEAFPQWSAARLLALGRFETPRTIKVVSAIAESFARGATAEQRQQIVVRLRAARNISPRNGFCAEIIMAADRIDEHREIMQEVDQIRPPRHILDSLLDAWLYRTPPHARKEIAPELRHLLAAPDAETRQRRARLEAVLAIDDASSREWIKDQLLQGPSSQVASTAVISFGRAVEGMELGRPVLAWLISLMPCKYTEATRAVAALIEDEDRFSEGTLRSEMPQLVPVAIARLSSAINGDESSLTIRALLELLARANRVSPMSADLIDDIFELIRRRLEPPPADISQVRRSDQFAAITDLRIFVGQIMAGRLPIQETFRRVGEVLLTLTDSQVRNNARDTLVNLLKSLGHDDLPSTCTWMRTLFLSTRIAVGVQLAIAQAMVELDGAEPGGRAAALENEANCPVQVTTYLQKHIRQ